MSYLATLLAAALLILMPTAGAQQQDTGIHQAVREAQVASPDAAQQDQGTATPTPNVWTVSIQDFFFDPADAAIASGDAIIFVNEGNEPHTVTADDGQFDSGPLNPGESVAVSFEGSGTLTYHCEIHPEMVGSVTVGQNLGEAEAAPQEEPVSEQPASGDTSGQDTSSEDANMVSGY